MSVLGPKARKNKLVTLGVFLLSIFSFILPARADFLPPPPQEQSSAALFGKYAWEGVKFYGQTLGPTVQGMARPFVEVAKSYGREVASLGWQAPAAAKDFVLSMASVGTETDKLLNPPVTRLTGQAASGVKFVGSSLALVGSVVKSYGHEVASLGWQALEVAKDFSLSMVSVGVGTDKILNPPVTRLTNTVASGLSSVRKNLASAVGAINNFSITAEVALGKVAGAAGHNLASNVAGILGATKRFMGETVYGGMNSTLGQWFKK